MLSKPVNASLLFDTMMHLANPELDEQLPEVPAPVALASLPSIHGARVLLVEDNEVNQQVACEMLVGAGLQVDVANHGAECLTMLAQGQYALVLMDMQMPVMNGLEATAAIRAGGRHDDLPIVAMTANVLDEDRDRCRQVGMNDFIAKPIEPEILWALLLRWIAPRQASVAPLPAPQPAMPPSSMAAPAIAGLDTAAGLRRVLGKQDAYLRMLQTFVRDQGDMAVHLAERLERSDRAGAGALLHTLRGVAGNIGAVRVQTLAQQMEQGLGRETAEELQTRHAALALELERVLDAVAAALPAVSTPKPQAAAALDRQLLDTVCARLLALMADNDAQAENLLHQQTDLLNAAFGASADAVRAALDQFDFDQAHALLAAAWQADRDKIKEARS